jgi:PadR family transcriptional regulator, regulatory protein PadR
MRSEARDPQLLKGVLPLLVLALLTEAESYGYELVTRLQADGLSDIAAGTVYPVLARLEREGLITSRLVASSSGPARPSVAVTVMVSWSQARVERVSSAAPAVVGT